jgi:uncharacterized membrane protein
MSAGASRSNLSEAEISPASRPRTVLALWALLTLYGVTRIFEILPTGVPQLAIVALHVLAPAAFAAIHGATVYRVRGIIAFFAISLVISNIFENLSVITGFPFGRYYFFDLMGPKLFHVPILLGLAYLGMGYLSWALAAVLGNPSGRLSGSRVVTRPLIATFIMVAWDLSQEPVWATVLHGWAWIHGGAYFGVPVSNFMGWYLTNYVIYQGYALYLRNRLMAATPLGFWSLPILFYACCAAGNVLQVIPRPVPFLVNDPAGMHWKVSDITATCALISIFIMGAFALLAWIRLADQKCEAK